MTLCSPGVVLASVEIDDSINEDDETKYGSWDQHKCVEAKPGKI